MHFTLSVELIRSGTLGATSSALIPKHSLMVSSTITGQEHGLPHVPVRPDISPSHSSPEAFDFLRRNLAECTGEHALCNAASSSVMPKRLVHIKNDHHAALVEVTDGSEHANAIYAALSYCWGGDPNFKAEKSNLSYLMENGFLIDSLPIVWQETIGLCRKLGLSYLWIDALCIVQDDEGDWVGESVHMGSIYDNAYLTIAPANSSSVDTPYLGSTPDTSRKPVRFTVLPAISGRLATTVFAREKPPHGPLREGKSIDQNPWRLRGWTLQEEILSRRLVIFGAEEMLWRCKTTVSCECQSSDYCAAWPKELFEGVGQSLREERELNMQRYWRYSVIGRFGHQQFTYPEDIFSALSGIAQLIVRATGWTYVAGMWKEHLLFGMCWYNTFVEGLEPSYRVYTAPTFSWASVNGIRQIHMLLHEDRFTPDAEVVDVNMELKYAGAPFSTLVDGCVVLRGQLALASLEYANGEYCIVSDSSTQGQDGAACREELKIWPDSHIQAVPVATSSPQGHQDKILWTGTRASKSPDGSRTARLGAPPPNLGGVQYGCCY